MTMMNQKSAAGSGLRQGLHSDCGRGHACIISEHAQSSVRCHDCPHWLRSLSNGGALRCQKTLMEAMFPFSHSPVLFLWLLPPAGHLSLVSTSSSCSGTTPSPMGQSRQKCHIHCSDLTIFSQQLENFTAVLRHSLEVWQPLWQQQLE